MERVIKPNTPSNELDLVLQYYSSFGIGFHRFDHVLPASGSNVFGQHGRKNNAEYIINDSIFMNLKS